MIEQAYEQAEAAGVELWNQDEAGPYHALPHEGEHWHPAGTPRLLPHESQRGGTATLVTLFRPATGVVRAKGVLSAPTVVLHPWLTEPFLQEVEAIERRHPAETFPAEADRPVCTPWETWLGHPLQQPRPPLRIMLIWENLAGHHTSEMVEWLLDHGSLPLSTPLSGSWLHLAESVQRIIVCRALCGQHPQTAHQVIDWLEHTVEGWNQHPTPCVWNGTSRRRRERARLRRLGGSGAAVSSGSAIAR